MISSHSDRPSPRASLLRNTRFFASVSSESLHNVTVSKKLLAGVELGGTKCVCILGSGPEDIRAREVVPTGEPEATLSRIEEILLRWRAEHGPAAALGIASFGPVDLVPASPTHGYILTTSKLGWSNTNVAGRLGRRLGVPVGFDTDVNGAALAEGRWGAARDLADMSGWLVCEEIPGRATVRFTAIASRGSHQGPRLRPGPESVPKIFPPSTSPGKQLPLRSGSCYTPWCWPRLHVGS